MGLGNRQNKKAAPSCYTAGLVTAFEGSSTSLTDYQTLTALSARHSQHQKMNPDRQK
jgi:hypothetical protein